MPYLLVAALGGYLLAPSPLAGPIRSADHVVHLARAQDWAQLLAEGQLRGWSWSWFFGAPIGELYPPLGDLGVISLHVLGLSWPSAYAWLFWAVFCFQGWVLVYLCRRLGLGAVTGLLAAALILLDPGFNREGGWMYTVEFGVWPQVLSTSLGWLGIALWIDGRRRHPPAAPRPRAAAAAWAAAILAHPIALPMLAMSAPTWVLFADAKGPAFTRARQVLSRVTRVTVLALGLSAWWLLPMLEHRAWMASYGWLFVPLDQMLEWLSEGRWAQRMPAVIGYAALLGALTGLASRNRNLRAVVVLALGAWLLSSSDTFWRLRLDRLSEGFTHIQYQRFIIMAKPGLFVLAATTLGWPWRRWLASPRAARRRLVGWVQALAGLVLLAYAAQASLAASDAHQVGEPQLHRGHAKLQVPDADFDAAMSYLRAQAEASPDDFWRVAVRAPRNVHWFMDASHAIGRPVYKMGFTPGDNFVHKPESGSRRLLDALRVRFVLRHYEGDRSLPKEVARFGDLRILERARPEAPSPWGVLRGRLHGPGTLERLQGEPNRLRVRVEGVQDGSELIFDAAGYPRWELTLDGAPLAWDEVPVLGDAPPASPQARAQGALRGGHAEGDTGRDPILIRARPPHDGVVELRYRDRDRGSLLAGLLSLLTLVSMLAARVLTRAGERPTLLRGPERAFTAGHRLLRRVRNRHLWLVGALLLLVAGIRWQRARTAEADTILAWTSEGSRATLGPVKTDMLIRPALQLRLDERVETQATVQAPCGRPLRGWAAIDDDRGKQRRPPSTRYELELGPEGEAPELGLELRHRPGRTHFELPPLRCEGSGRLQIRARRVGKGAPELGLWLEIAETKEAQK